LARRRDGPDGQLADRCHDAPQQVLLVLKVCAERHENERVVTRWRCPFAGPYRVVQSRPDVFDRGRQRPDEVERAARHHQYAGGASTLVENVLEWFQALLGALALGLIDQVVVNLVLVVFGSGRPFFATDGLAEPLLFEDPTTIV
jgi:hypothetical protein